ncbi:MAG TPA: class I SAM-dependent methyltransferase [Rhizomicrobium sp.]|nr:class I SAM-dependent methyltransferase [Rhizomicrobium sp.]
MRRIAAIAAFLLTACLTTYLAAVTSGRAQQTRPEADVAPTINQNFKSANLDVESWATRFSGESREVFRARDDVLKALALKPGDRIADIGAGTGVYTRLFAQAVGPSGTVYATDIAPKFLAYIKENAAKDGLKNVQTVLGSDRDTNLKDASVDVAFSCDVYHHFEYPMTMNASIRRALKPGGRLYVLEMEKTGAQTSHVRAPKQEVIAEIEKSGFKLAEEVKVPGLHDNYLLEFRK